MSDRRRPTRPLFSMLLALCLLSLHAGFLVTARAAGGVTVMGKVLDGEGKPLRDVTVTVRGAGDDQVLITDRKGRVKVKVSDPSVPHEVSFDREGYPTQTVSLTFTGDAVQTTEWRLTATPPDASTSSMTALHAYNAGVEAFNKGDLDLALQELGKALAEDPEFAQAHAAVAGIHGDRGDHEQAALAAERALALDPDYVPALRMLYFAQLELGREEASETVDRLAELDPDPQTANLLFNEGVAAHSAGDLRRALGRYVLASRIVPENARFHAAVAGAHLALKNYDEALRSSERVLEIEPDHTRGLSFRFNALIALGRNDEAEVALETLQRVAPGAVADAFFERGALLYEEGHLAAAVSALERALQANSKLARGHYTLALCYMNLGRDAEAREHLQTFLDLAPDDPDAAVARQLLQALAG